MIFLLLFKIRKTGAQERGDDGLKMGHLSCNGSKTDSPSLTPTASQFCPNLADAGNDAPTSLRNSRPPG